MNTSPSLAESRFAAGNARDRPRIRPCLLIALAGSVLLHLVLSLWPVDLTAVPDPPPLLASITELPPPPPAVAPPSKPKAKPRRTSPVAPPAPVHTPEPAPVVASEAPAPIDPTPEAIAAGPDLPAVPVDVVAEAGSATLAERSDKTLPPRVDLVYKGFLGTRGFMLGDATYRFEHAGNQYKISTVGELRGLAALLYPGQGRLESHGSITAAGLLPYEFSFERGSRDRREVASFDWEAGVVTLQDQKMVALELPTFDWLAIMWQYYFSPPAGNEVSFSVATTRRVVRYTITREDDEKIEWGQGEIDTIRWHRRSEDGKSDGYVWLAPSLQYIPVKMRYIGPRGTFEALLDSIRVDENIGPAHPTDTNASERSGAPIKAPHLPNEEAKTGRLGEEGNAERRPRAGAPFGLLPKTPIAALQSLAGQPAHLRFAPCAERFRPCNAFVSIG